MVVLATGDEPGKIWKHRPYLVNSASFSWDWLQHLQNCLLKFLGECLMNAYVSLWTSVNTYIHSLQQLLQYLHCGEKHITLLVFFIFALQKQFCPKPEAASWCKITRVFNEPWLWPEVWHPFVDIWTNFNGKWGGSYWQVTPVLWHEEHTGCHGLGMLPLLLPQTAGPYTCFMNHHLLYTELYSINCNKNVCGSFGTDVRVDTQIL